MTRSEDMVSTTEKLTGTGEPAPAEAPAPAARWTRRRTVIAAATAGTLVVAGAAGFAVRAALTGPPPAPTAPITLPTAIEKLQPVPEASDPTRVARWAQQASTAAKGTALSARTYGVVGGRTMRVVAARTDLKGALEEGWAVDAGQKLKDNSCTQNVRLVAGGKAGVRPTVVLCWRNTPELSAYVALIDPRKPVTPAEGSAALDQVWESVSRR
jgi:hypothetical protein